MKTVYRGRQCAHRGPSAAQPGSSPMAGEGRWGRESSRNAAITAFQKREKGARELHG